VHQQTLVGVHWVPGCVASLALATARGVNVYDISSSAVPLRRTHAFAFINAANSTLKDVAFAPRSAAAGVAAAAARRRARFSCARDHGSDDDDDDSDVDGDGGGIAVEYREDSVATLYAVLEGSHTHDVCVTAVPVPATRSLPVSVSKSSASAVADACAELFLDLGEEVDLPPSISGHAATLHVSVEAALLIVGTKAGAAFALPLPRELQDDALDEPGGFMLLLPAVLGGGVSGPYAQFVDLPAPHASVGATEGAAAAAAAAAGARCRVVRLACVGAGTAGGSATGSERAVVLELLDAARPLGTTPTGKTPTGKTPTAVPASGLRVSVQALPREPTSAASLAADTAPQVFGLAIWPMPSSGDGGSDGGGGAASLPPRLLVLGDGGSLHAYSPLPLDPAAVLAAVREAGWDGDAARGGGGSSSLATRSGGASSSGSGASSSGLSMSATAELTAAVRAATAALAVASPEAGASLCGAAQSAQQRARIAASLTALEAILEKRQTDAASVSASEVREAALSITAAVNSSASSASSASPPTANSTAALAAAAASPPLGVSVTAASALPWAPLPFERPHAPVGTFEALEDVSNDVHLQVRPAFLVLKNTIEVTPKSCTCSVRAPLTSCVILTLPFAPRQLSSSARGGDDLKRLLQAGNGEFFLSKTSEGGCVAARLACPRGRAIAAVRVLVGVVSKAHLPKTLSVNGATVAVRKGEQRWCALDILRNNETCNLSDYLNVNTLAALVITCR